mgnify:CR=1 FL=1
MASGTITGTTSNENIDVKLEWEFYSQGSVINQSYLNYARLYYKRNNSGFTTYGTGTFTISIYDPVNDKTHTKTVQATVNITESGWVKVAEYSGVYVRHKDNGIGTATISATGSVSGTTLTSTTLSKTVTLDTIGRASTIDLLSCATSYFTGTMTYKYTPKSGELYNRCNISLNLDGDYIPVKTIDLDQKYPSQQTATVTLSSSELSTVYYNLPSAKKGTLRFTLRTYSDEYNTQVGEAGYKEISLTIPNDTTTQPTATLTVSSVHSLGSAFDGLYIKGKSKANATLDSGAGKYGATPKSYKVTIGTQSGASPLTSAYLTTPGELTIKGTVTDSREYSRTYTKTITVIDYSSPRILPASGWDNVIAARCKSDGVLDSNGTNLRIVAKRSYSKVMVSGAQKNYCKIQYRYKTEGGSYSSWVDIRLGTETSDDVSTVASGVTLEATKTYAVQIRAVDDIGDAGLTTITISSQRVYMHKAGSLNSLGIGKYVGEDNTIDIGEDFTVKVRGKLLVGDEASAVGLEDGLPSLPVSISDTGWISLGLSSAVSESPNNTGRNGKGCYYRVINGNHVYVAFNCALVYEGDIVIVNSTPIPSEYCPARNAYTFVPTGGRSIIRAIANHSGNIVIDWVQSMIDTANTTSANVTWIDGYIDYWI